MKCDIVMTDYRAFMEDKCMNFAVRIVNLYKHLSQNKRENVLSKQLLRSGTSIGANYAEATNAISKADFIAKISISLKECTESKYWIELLHRTEYLSDDEYESILSDCKEILALLTTTMKKSKEK